MKPYAVRLQETLDGLDRQLGMVERGANFAPVRPYPHEVMARRGVAVDRKDLTRWTVLTRERDHVLAALRRST